jgi:hypothetical protein
MLTGVSSQAIKDDLCALPIEEAALKGIPLVQCCLSRLMHED